MRTSTHPFAALIEARYPLDRGWLCLGEVTPPAHRETARRFDAVAIGLWQSMAKAVHGFEFKTARSDWLNERAHPEKAEGLMRWCDGYWLVCPTDVAQPDEVPPTWGLLNVTPGGVLRQRRAAPRLQPIERGESFWRCMLLRYTQRSSATPEEISAAHFEGVLQGGKQADERWKRAQEDNRAEIQKLRQLVARFETAAGVSLLHRWDGGEPIARAALTAMQVADGDAARQIEAAISNGENALKALRDVQAAMAEVVGVSRPA